MNMILICRSAEKFAEQLHCREDKVKCFYAKFPQQKLIKLTSVLTNRAKQQKSCHMFLKSLITMRAERLEITVNSQAQGKSKKSFGPA